MECPRQLKGSWTVKKKDRKEEEKGGGGGSLIPYKYELVICGVQERSRGHVKIRVEKDKSYTRASNRYGLYYEARQSEKFVQGRG